MKMISGSVKGAGAIFVVWLTYLNNTFSPLLWVLLALIFVDLVFNIHKEGQQFNKLGSAAMSLGLPTVIENYMGHSEFGKYLVAIMCLAYLQVIVPQFLAKVSSLSFVKDPAQNSKDQAIIKAAAIELANQIASEAQAIKDSAAVATIGTPTKEDQGGA